MVWTSSFLVFCPQKDGDLGDFCPFFPASIEAGLMALFASVDV